MEKLLTIFINDVAVFDCDREQLLDDQKLAFFDKMDADMAQGIKLKGELIKRPNTEQCTRFVIMNLVKALQQENSASIFATSAYLTNRLPELIEVRVSDGEDSINIDLVNDSD